MRNNTERWHNTKARGLLHLKKINLYLYIHPFHHPHPVSLVYQKNHPSAALLLNLNVQYGSSELERNSKSGQGNKEYFTSAQSKPSWFIQQSAWRKRGRRGKNISKGLAAFAIKPLSKAQHNGQVTMGREGVLQDAQTLKGATGRPCQILALGLLALQQ